MRTATTCIALLFILLYSPVHAQWTRVADFGGPATDGCISFVIDGMAYVGGGPGVQAFYRYDPGTDTWMKRADIGGGPRGWAFAFAINGKGYVGGGDPTGSFQPVNDFWEYDPATDSWTQLGNFPGGNRDAMLSFAIGDVGYCGAGFDGTNSYSDFWSYYPPTDTWTQIGSYPGGAVLFPVSFVIDGKAYAGTGTALPEVDTFFEYNPQTNQWRPLPDFPGGPRQAAVGFAADGKGYLGGGLNGPYGTATQYNDFYQYDPQTEQWSKWDDGTFPIDNLSWSSAFVIDDVAYLGTGVKVPDFQYTRRFYRYVFGGVIEHSLNSGGSLNMGSILSGETRDTVITFTNSGNKAVQVSDISLSGNSEGAFSIQAPSVPMEVMPGGDMAVTVTFSPQDAGVFTAMLNVTSDASIGGSIAIPIAGQGTSLEPSLALTPTQLLFGYVTVGEMKDSTIELRNTGQALLTVTGIIIENDGEGHFSLPGLNVPLTIDPGAAENVTVRFMPGTAGDFTARFSVLSDAANGELNATLVGVGKAPSRELGVSLDEIDFGTVYLRGDKDTVLRVSNSGSDPLTITDAVITGNAADKFGYPSMQFPYALEAGEHLDIALTYAPGIDEGTHVATLTIQSDATNGTERAISLTGTCTPAPEARIELDVMALDFGDVEIDESAQMQIVASNTGTLAVTMTAYAIANDASGVFSVNGQAVPVTLDPSETSVLTVTFDPDALGEFTGTLSISTDVPGSELIEIMLSGSGVPVTGIDPVPIPARSVELYPNPAYAGGRLILNSSDERSREVSLYNTSGKLIHDYGTIESQQNESRLTLPPALRPGMYMLLVQQRDGHLIVPVLVIPQ